VKTSLVILEAAGFAVARRTLAQESGGAQGLAFSAQLAADPEKPVALRPEPDAPEGNPKRQEDPAWKTAANAPVST
jgi:hypothetical protein